MTKKNCVDLWRFRNLLDGLLMTREQIAKDLECDPSTITKHYSGALGISVDYLVKYSDLFGVSTDYLLGISDAATLDKDIQAVCDHTGLTSDAVKILRGAAYGSDIREILNFFLQSSNMLDESFSKTHAFILFCKSFMGYKRALEYSNDFYKQYFDMHIDPTALSTEESKGLIHNVMTGTDRANAAEYQIQKQAAKMAELFCGNLIKENTELNKQFALDGIMLYEQIEEGEQYGCNQETQ